MFRIINEIKRHKPCLSTHILLSVITIIISIVAIWVPVEIAKQQNGIALFEKRYRIYYELKIIDDFLDGYYKTRDYAIEELPIENLDKLSKEEREAIYYESLWEGEIHKNQYLTIDDAGAILKLQAQIIEPLDILFSDITSDEKTLCRDFLNTYLAMTQQYVLVRNSDKYIINGELEESYERLDLSKLLEKLRRQLEL